MLKTNVSYKKILTLALPIYGGLFASQLVIIADTYFLGQIDSVQQSAAGIGGLFYTVFFLIGYGFTTGAQILIARRIGENRLPEVGKIFWNMIGVSMLYATAVSIYFAFFSEHLFRSILHSEEIAHQAGMYMSYRAFGFLGTQLSWCFAAYNIGRASSLAVTIASLVNAVINILLAWVFIFGLAGFEKMELKGAAIAAAIADVASALTYIGYTLVKKDYVKYSIGKFTFFTKKYLHQLFRVGFPLVVQSSLSIVAWFIFFVLIENTGKANFEVSIIIRSIYSVFMMSSIALASAANSMVSNIIGQKRETEVIPLVYKIVKLSFIFSLVVTPMLLLIPTILMQIFTQDPYLIPMAGAPLISVYIAILCFSASTVLFQSVSGTGKTQVALGIEAICIGLYLVYAIYTTRVAPQSLMVIWMDEVLYMVTLAIFSSWYLHSKRWQKTRI